LKISHPVFNKGVIKSQKFFKLRSLGFFGEKDYFITEIGKCFLRLIHKNYE